jgi:nicotinate-nucleotide adenylyltransferase
VLAQEAGFQLGLGEVLLVPAGEAPHRRIDPEPGPKVRLEMTTLAAENDDLVSASDIEVTRPGPSYTFQTLELLREARPDEEIWFLMGADVAAQLEDWRRPRRVLELARVAIATRPGTAIDEAVQALERLGASHQAELIEMPELAVSSTRIRRRVAEGRPIRYLVPDPVERLIRERGLYRSDSSGVIAA